MRRPAGHRGSQEDLNADASYFALKNSVDAHGVIGLRAGVRERSALSGRLGGNWVHIGVNARFDHGEPAHGEYSQGWLRLRRSKHHRWSWMKRSLPVPPRRRPAYVRPLVGGDGSPALDRRVRSKRVGEARLRLWVVLTAHAAIASLPSQRRDESSVDRDVRADNVGGEPAGKQQHEVGDLVGPVGCQKSGLGC
jgi:hypothetical protein